MAGCNVVRRLEGVSISKAPAISCVDVPLLYSPQIVLLIFFHTAATCEYNFFCVVSLSFILGPCRVLFFPFTFFVKTIWEFAVFVFLPLYTHTYIHIHAMYRKPSQHLHTTFFRQLGYFHLFHQMLMSDVFAMSMCC